MGNDESKERKRGGKVLTGRTLASQITCQWDPRRGKTETHLEVEFEVAQCEAAANYAQGPNEF